MRSRSLVAVLVTACVLATGSSVADPATYETNVSRDSYWRSGEPSVAVNALDSENVVFASTQLFVYPFVARQRIQPQEQLVDHFFFRCQIAVSFDRGVTWRRQLFGVDPVKSVCGDTVVSSASDGTLYAGAVRMDRALNAEAIVASSNDGGSTWSHPVQAMSGLSILQNAGEGNLYPLPGPTSTGDRPFLHVDQVTGAVHVTANGNPLGLAGLLLGIVVGDRLGDDRPKVLPQVGHRFLSSSHDAGNTWTKPRPIDSADLPAEGGFPGPSIDAAFGTVGASYTLADGSGGIFQTSTDAGTTWTRHQTPFQGGVVAADPTSAGRFAVLVSDGAELDVYVTADAGSTWSGPVQIAEAPPDERSHTWLAFGRNGVLGASWRTHTEDGTYRQWAAISRNAGLGFDAPVPVSGAPSPPSVAAGPGDDCACNGLALDDHYLHTGWADERGDQTDTWYGRYLYAP